MLDLYKNIERLCKERGITVTQMCRECGASRGSLGDLANGRIQTLSANSLQKIATFFNVSTDYITGESKYKNIQEVKDYNWGFGDPYFEAAFDFAKLLKNRREYMDISLSALGQVIGANGEQMEEIEDGFLPITYDQAEKLCEYLGTNVSQVLFDNNLYGEPVPEEYHKRVREWEQINDKAIKKSDNDLNAEERLLISDYRMLNNNGQKEARKRINELTELERYKRS